MTWDALERLCWLTRIAQWRVPQGNPEVTDV